MSGGSYEYLCFKMQEAALKLMKRDQSAYRKAFGELMMKCSKAMHDIEWVDSADLSEGDDLKSIMNCIAFSDVLKATTKDAEKVSSELDELIRLSKIEFEKSKFNESH